MGRLFWKFFLSILLAQVAATIGIGGTVWLRDQARQRGTEPTLDVGPPAVIMLDAAKATLKHAGVGGLRELAATSRRVRLFVLDASGHELLGRSVPAKLREEVERTLEGQGQAHAVARLTAPDGQRYLAFASRMPYGVRTGTGGAAGEKASDQAAGSSMDKAGIDKAGSGNAAPAGTDGSGASRGGTAAQPPQRARRSNGGNGSAGDGGADGADADPGNGPDGAFGGAPGAGFGGPPAGFGGGPGFGGDGGPGGPGGPGMGPGMGGGMFGLPPDFGRHIGRWLPIVAATLASLLFAVLLAWYFSRPIRALRSAFESAAAGDLAPKFAASTFAVGGDELAELGHDFDRMSAQLRTLMEGQRRLLHDVSHELRSPLARLQAAIGLAHQQPDKVHASLERIERESVRMDRLVGELLTLSRLEASSALPAIDTIDLVEMVDQIADDARFEAGARIDVDAPVPVAVRGAPDLLWSAVENIMRNAVKHGGADNAVEVALHPDHGQVHIEVLDRGPGIAEEHLGDVFEPFFRSNPTRNNVDGHGLGMAIAKRVVDTHGGSITAANREGGGLRVTISLPRELREPQG
ncbi:HAMP domain-containing protein [Massilia forsythiae]|uniref:histidine kinase n=1 Tax=Massilia forsythiae TaxID=2728020 RepID=A0A7Z2W009_9BURK|nr:ATP-binding protein [Massilia forsythiae]QJE02567.1 HAMP domain-containing protein [Massilia forsythiae]